MGRISWKISCQVNNTNDGIYDVLDAVTLANYQSLEAAQHVKVRGHPLCADKSSSSLKSAEWARAPRTKSVIYVISDMW
jgi:hypothetical protein